MIEHEFEQGWSERESRYPGWRPLPADRPVHIQVDAEYGATYAGQVAAITAASLFGRMSKTVAAEVPSLKVLAPLPWTGSNLDEVVFRTLADAHLYGVYEQRSARLEDFRVVVGPRGNGLVVHGSGWSAYCGSAPSPISLSDETNPFGAAFAVIAGASRLQSDTDAVSFQPVSVDTFLWRPGMASADVPGRVFDAQLGELWCVGVGSVGSCALFFLSLATRAFRALLVDRDIVKVENVTRSALFSWRDALEGKRKVDVATRWLNEAGIDDTETEIAWLDEIPNRWLGRRAGTPNALISAANERNVRHEIESGFPPLQVYATTGRNWQSTLFRHIPLREPCSLCVPGSEKPQAPALCATGSREPTNNNGEMEEDDVALPFLSYAAGLMTAAEVTKLALTGEVVTPNRVFFEPRARDLVRVVELNKRPGCVCQLRDSIVHEKVIRGSRFAPLSASRPS